MNNDKDCGVLYDQDGKHIGAFFVVPDSCRVDVAKIDETKDKLVAMRFNGDFNASALGKKVLAVGNLLLRDKAELNATPIDLANFVRRESTVVESERRGINMSRVRPYWIEWDRCDTFEKIVSWVMHLLEKEWITKDHIEDFVRAACKHAGVSPFCDT